MCVLLRTCSLTVHVMKKGLAKLGFISRCVVRMKLAISRLFWQTAYTRKQIWQANDNILYIQRGSAHSFERKQTYQYMHIPFVYKYLWNRNTMGILARALLGHVATRGKRHSKERHKSWRNYFNHFLGQVKVPVTRRHQRSNFACFNIAYQHAYFRQTSS